MLDFYWENLLSMPETWGTCWIFIGKRLQKKNGNFMKIYQYHGISWEYDEIYNQPYNDI